MKDIIEGNKLIAEFMGGWWETNDQPNPYWENVISRSVYPADKDLIYHESWDVLMPVVEKIESLGYWIRMDYGDVFIVDDDSTIIIENPMHEPGYSKLSLVWEVCVEFIKWYNQNK